MTSNNPEKLNITKMAESTTEINNVLLQDYAQKEVENAIKELKPQIAWNRWYTSRSI